MASNNYNMNETDMLVPIYTDYITKNPSWTNPIISIDGIVFHDVGVGTSKKTAEQWQARWNREESKNSIHSIVTIDKTCIMMPCFEQKGKAKKVWGVGKGSKGSFNASRIQFESACSGELVYKGASFTIKNKDKAIEEETKIRDNCIDFMARVCIYHELDPLGTTKQGYPVIVDHFTAHQLSMGSNHADISGDKIKGLPEVYPSLDFIRQKVKERMETIKAEEELQNMTQAEFDSYLLKASPSTIDKLFQSYFDRLSKKSASSYAKEDLAWAKDNGLLVGSQGNQMPQMFTKREDMCAVLHRYHEEFVQTKRQ